MSGDIATLVPFRNCDIFQASVDVESKVIFVKSVRMRETFCYLFELVAIFSSALRIDIRESLMPATLPKPVPTLRIWNFVALGNTLRASLIRISQGLLCPNAASMNSISSLPHLMDLKKVVAAADVARATSHMVQSRKPVDVS